MYVSLSSMVNRKQSKLSVIYAIMGTSKTIISGVMETGRLSIHLFIHSMSDNEDNAQAASP